ncbi:MAG TPA: hypothetical protein DCK76_08495 [Desulfotomaculum sp.]|nr:hypothetical protein [Desulfotomaculum sp.]HBY05173.1 hypothetical protein [Desulfotomaculum sp.]
MKFHTGPSLTTPWLSLATTFRIITMTLLKYREWEEFKFQVQNEESFFFEAYEDTIRAICRNLIRSFPESELKLLWLHSNAYFNCEKKGSLFWMK